MSVFVLEHLAKRLDVSSEQARTSLAKLLQELRNELQAHQVAHLPGIGTFEQTEAGLTFSPDKALSLSVNNRYGALKNELVHANFEQVAAQSSENGTISDENGVDGDVMSSLFPQDISTNIFEEQTNGDVANLEHVSLDANPFDADLLNTDQENIFFSSPITSTNALQPNQALDPASMKEEDPNSNHSEQEPLESNTEWSPFFEELEGEEFDIDTTIDLSSEDWEAEFPSPPSSPFSSSENESSGQDDLYFDVDADPDDTLFSPASNNGSDGVSYDNDLSWAANPLDESTEFFEDDVALDTATFSDAYDDRTQTFSAEDEFFSPVSDSANTATPDDTLFSSDTAIYSEEASVEADDTIFLAPDQTVQSNESAARNPYAPPGGSSFADKEPAKDRNPYVYKQEAQKSSSSSWIWIGSAVVLLLAAAGALWFLKLPPFGPGNGNSPLSPPAPAVVESVPPSSSASGGVDGTPNSGETTDPSNSLEVGSNSSTAGTPTTSAPEPQPAPVIQRIPIDRNQGGYTIVVASELLRNDAQQIADQYTQEFQGRGFPIDVLTTTEYDVPRHRVGIGQFGEYRDATAVLTNIKSRLPSDAWLLKIE